MCFLNNFKRSHDTDYLDIIATAMNKHRGKTSAHARVQQKMVGNLNLFCKTKTIIFIVKGYSNKEKNTVDGQSGHK